MGAPIELRFADFEVSPRSGELRRNGLKIKLQEQPFQILVLLLEQRGETVTREGSFARSFGLPIRLSTLDAQRAQHRD